MTQFFSLLISILTLTILYILFFELWVVELNIHRKMLKLVYRAAIRREIISASEILELMLMLPNEFDLLSSHLFLRVLLHNTVTHGCVCILNAS